MHQCENINNNARFILMEESFLETIKEAYQKITRDVKKLEEEIEKREKEYEELEANETKSRVIIEKLQNGLKGIERKEGYEKMYEKLSGLVDEKQREIEKYKRKINRTKNKIKKLKQERDELNKARRSFWEIINEYESEKTLKISKDDLRKDRMSYGQWG